jgi:hypothetical protein
MRLAGRFLSIIAPRRVSNSIAVFSSSVPDSGICTKLEKEPQESQYSGHILLQLLDFSREMVFALHGEKNTGMHFSAIPFVAKAVCAPRVLNADRQNAV